MVSQLLLVLSSPQLIVNALKLDKIFMFTLFTHIPLIDYKDKVAILNGTQSVRNGETRSTLTRNI